jgi:hypothetical protein
MAGHFRRPTLSMRGTPIDFSQLSQQHQSQRALGNANMNAKGDRLDENGQVVKSVEQIEAEWVAAKARRTTQMADIKASKLAPDPMPAAPPSSATMSPSDQAAPAFPSIEDLIRDGLMPTPGSKKGKTA